MPTASNYWALYLSISMEPNLYCGCIYGIVCVWKWGVNSYFTNPCPYFHACQINTFSPHLEYFDIDLINYTLDTCDLGDSVWSVWGQGVSQTLEGDTGRDKPWRGRG